MIFTSLWASQPQSTSTAPSGNLTTSKCYTEDGNLGLCSLSPSPSQVLQAGNCIPISKLRFCFFLKGTLQAIGCQMLDI